MRMHTFHQLPTGAWWEEMNPGFTAQSTTVSLQPHALAKNQCPRPVFKTLRLHKALRSTPLDSLVPINIYLGIFSKPFLVFGLTTYWFHGLLESHFLWVMKSFFSQDKATVIRQKNPWDSALHGQVAAMLVSRCSRRRCQGWKSYLSLSILKRFF